MTLSSLHRAALVQKENAELERQTIADVQEFLKDEREGTSSPGLMKVSGAFGKGVLFTLTAVSLAGIFASFAARAEDAPVTEPTAIVNVQKASPTLKAPVLAPTMTFTAR